MMKIAAAYDVECPTCGEECYVSMKNIADFWTAGKVWRCPHCGDTVTTEQLQEETKNVIGS